MLDIATPTWTLQNEKIQQAVSILKERKIDAWLIFARETDQMPERTWELLAPGGIVWQSAILLTPGGDRIAIVGEGDVENYRRSGLYTQVHSYTRGIRELLLQTLDKLRPAQIAVNYSKSNPAADGLTYGMYLLLQDYLAGTPYLDRLVSADPLVSRLRGRKTGEEIARINSAIIRTVELLDEITQFVQPGITERTIAGYLHNRMAESNVEPAWELGGDPIVNAGPQSVPGHGAPSNLQVERGQLLHIDFGIKQNEYCSDLQRMWYIARPGETTAPQNLQRAFNAVLKTIQESARVLKPGAVGWQVDARAREVITGEGFPEYQHALGHQLGRTAHDGGTLLGPRWERYGDTPYGVVEENEVYTLELGVTTEAGYLGLEEDVLITQDGVAWLSPPQTELWVIK